MLGYHLTNNLYKTPRSSLCHVTSSFAQLIDRNYYPLKAGLKVTSDGDKLNKLWGNKDFEKFLTEIKDIKSPKIVDLVFRLLEMSGKTRDTFIDLMRKSKTLTINDNKTHNFSLGVDEDNEIKGGITFFSFGSKYYAGLEKQLSVHCERKKYSTKSNYWIGFGSILNSPKLIDMVYLNDSKWTFDKIMDDLINRYPLNSGQYIKYNKTGRNKPCKCGSGLKYKNCCGK